ncbi:ParA family protein [Paenibacillus sp. EPM92]|uniref:ParA family protein n=1 Tax=Paenibacillus sp. EPM92 TaxID=1561195 RepID=UPI001915FD68|nr:ParA family protein [Paenibacillus sp. EPM92]
MVTEIQSNVKIVVSDIENAGKAANAEVEKAKKTTADLVKINEEIVVVQKAVAEISQNAVDANKGASEFLNIVEQIAAAAEQQSSASEEVEKSLQLQNKAFDELNSAASELAQIAEDLKLSTDAQKSSEALAAAAQELAANVEEANSTSSEIMKSDMRLSTDRIKLIVPNMFDQRTNDSKENLALLKEFIADDHLLTEPIHRRVKIAEAGKLGKTVFEYDDESAQQFLSIVKKVISKNAQEEQ